MNELATIDGTSARQMVPVLTPEQEAQLVLHEAMEVLTLAKAVRVTTPEEFSQAGKACQAIKDAMKRADAKRDSLVRPLNSVVKTINAEFKVVEGKFQEALRCYTGPMTAFQTEQERIRRQAEELARLDRERKEAEAREIARQAEEAALKARQEAEDAAAKLSTTTDPFEAALLEAQADEAHAASTAALETAKDAYREAARTPSTIFAPAKVTAVGVRTTTVYDYEITDPDQVPMRFRPIDERLIAAEVRTLKDKAAIPGVKITSRVVVG